MAWLPDSTAEGWQLILVRPDGTQLTDMPDARDRRVTFKLNGVDEVHFTVPGGGDTAALIQELSTEVLVVHAGLPLTRCRIGATSDEMDQDRHDVEVNALDYLALLDRRFFMTEWQYTNQRLVDMAWDMIDYTQFRVAWAGGDWGIRRGLIANTTQTTTHKVEAGTKIGQAIDEMHNVYPGFDYEIDADRRFNTWAFRGTRRDFALDYGGNVAKVTRTLDPARYGNAIRQSGADGVAAQTRAAPDLAARPEGRFEEQQGNTDLDNATLVGWSADAYLERHGTWLPTYEVTLNPQAGWDPSRFWLGDMGTLVVRSGRLDVVSIERAYEIDVALTDDGAADVEITFGDLREDLLALVRQVPEQIQKINRR